MTYDDELTLIREEVLVVPPGVEQKTKTRTTVLCARKRLSQTAYVAARTAGLEPALLILVHGYEYGGETLAEYQGALYAVKRGRMDGFEEVELELERVNGR